MSIVIAVARQLAQGRARLSPVSVTRGLTDTPRLYFKQLVYDHVCASSHLLI